MASALPLSDSMVIGSVNSGIPFPLSSVSYDQLSFHYKHFCLSISYDVGPQFYYQAAKVLIGMML